MNAVVTHCTRILLSLLPNSDEIAAVADVSGFFGGSSTTALTRLLTPRRRWAGLATAAPDRRLCIDRRWPSKTAVSQVRLFSVSTAQIFAAAPASFSGPATSRKLHAEPVGAFLDRR